VDLALAGHLPPPCIEARVTSERVHREAGALQEQRTRWEHGHLEVLRTGVPRLLRAAWQRKDARLLALGLELSVPPLSLLLLLWLGVSVIAWGAAALGASHLPAWILAFGALPMVAAVAAAWLSFGRDIFPASLWLQMPLYSFSKLPLYAAYLTHRRRFWSEARQPAVQTAAETARVVQLEGAALDAITEAQCVKRVMADLAERRGGWIATLNLDHLRLITRSPEYARLCADATLRVADGMPLVWASRLQGTALPERVAGSNLIWSLSAAAAARGHSIFLLGGAPGTATAAAEVLRRRFSGLMVAGTASPDVDLVARPDEIATLAATVTRVRPDIVYVALGKPKQEQVIDSLRTHLPQAWFVPVGISFSFVSGRVRRAPPWVQQLGLEWAHRLVQEPQRLARRYLIEGIPFALMLLLRSARVGAQRRMGSP
jgi:N-acetylglucosaminyldiphosphoundecaprenol N-acetyl-beta-D-mannosaminyltransferase